MSRESEKNLRKMMNYVEETLSGNADDTETETLIRQYIAQQNSFAANEDVPECADDYFELAEEADSRKKRLEYLKKALELEPNHLDAARMLAKENAKTADEYLEALAALIKKGDKLMEQEGYFSSSMGEFWLLLETRPYMRLHSEYLHTLIECGKMRAASAEGRRMLELCENDNLGIRFSLMHIYALLEEEEAAEKLFKRYEEDNASLMLLPMAVLYYKLSKPEKSVEYLNRLALSNKDTKKFFAAVKNGKLKQYFETMSPYGYQPYSIEELMLAIAENEFLYVNSTEFFPWANAKLKQTGGKQPTKKGK